MTRDTTTARRWRRWGAAAAALVALGGGFVAAGGCKHTVAPRETLTSDEVRTATAFPFQDYDAIVHQYVDTEGRVNYQALRRNRAPLDRFLAFVAQAGPASRADLFPTENHRKAYFVAAYNATVFRNVIDRGPINNIDDNKVSFFYGTRFVINGREINLVDLENEIIRPTFHDPRLHFALNCASGGCPRLPNEAFVPDRIEEQLEREARRFCNEERNVRPVTAERKIYLSHIFDWYAQDFVDYENAHGHQGGDRVTFINRYRDAEHQLPRDFEVEFVDYDWTINAQAAAGQPPSS
ncbi:MAG: DUF547 domain-containing protein [Deltaproteobacteria bacterium]|nr:DUF547 domain-containing protein [Deltaproteobacteria bacterium]